MKIECIKEKLLWAINSAEKVTGKNLTLPILSSILLETKQSSLVVRATNLDLGIEIITPAKIVEEGSVVVPGNLLSGLLSNVQEEKITLETVEGGLVVSTKNTSSTIKTLPSEDFPIIPKVDALSVSFEASAFAHGLSSVWYSAAVTSMKPELASVYLYSDQGELVFVATDSFRLAEKRISLKKDKDIGSMLIPFKNIPEIVKFLEATKGEVELSVDGGQVSFSREGGYLVSRIIEGTFPDYRQIIPKEAKTEAVVLKQDFLGALKLTHVFSDSFNQVSMRIIPGEKLFEMTTKNATLGENHTTLDAVLKGEDMVLSFNYKYIVDCFQSIRSDSLTLSFHGAGKPMLIQGVNDKSFLYVVMPMNK